MSLLLGVAFIVAATVIPEIIRPEHGLVFAMSNFISSSVSWAGKENYDYFLKPLFVGPHPLEMQGIRIIPNVQDKQLLNYFSPAAKLLKAYSKGFSGTAGVTYSQRTLNVYKMKAEAAEDATVFFNTVYNALLQKGNWNDLTGPGGQELLMNIIIELFTQAVRSDVYRQYWLSDTAKETVVTTYQSGVADTAYNAFDGIWKKIFANNSATPSATQIKRYAVSDGAVAQVQTVTLTGTSGTCNITIDGVAYLATFATSITVTNDNFRTAYGAALLLRGYALTGTATLIVTATKVGQPAAAITVSAALTGDLTGSVAATTPNTAPAALGAGEAYSILDALWIQAPKVLKTVPKVGKVFLVGDLVYDNMVQYLESTSWAESAYRTIIEGLPEMLTFRGIPVINVNWDYHLDADFPHVTGSLYAYPHRCIYTALDNLVLGIDSANEFNATDFWYNKDEQENRFRTQLVMGPEYVHNQLMIVGF